MKSQTEGKNRTWQIKFMNKTFYIIDGGDCPKSGAIATKKQYYNFEESFAHLNPNGEIMRYGMKIGNINDIKFIKRVIL